jgi:hypothetical protein
MDDGLGSIDVRFGTVEARRSGTGRAGAGVGAGAEVGGADIWTCCGVEVDSWTVGSSAELERIARPQVSCAERHGTSLDRVFEIVVHKDETP